jgi:hypothetical protein
MYSEATAILFFERLRLRSLPTIMQEHGSALRALYAVSKLYMHSPPYHVQQFSEVESKAPFPRFDSVRKFSGLPGYCRSRPIKLGAAVGTLQKY